MPDLFESAAAIMRAAERRLEVVSQNVSNVATAGYKRRLAYADTLAARGAADAPAAEIAVAADDRQGKLAATGNAFDLAISGPGYFRLRAGDALILTRQGSFRRGEGGTLLSPQGHALQQAGGGDLVLRGERVTVAEDGTVLEDGAPVARIGVYAATGGDAALAGEIEEPVIRQGMIEQSNVATGDEMVAMMAAMRQAETGARLIQLYDELLGRTLTALGQSGR